MGGNLKLWFLYFGLAPLFLSFISFALMPIGMNNIMLAALITLIPGGLYFGYVATKKSALNERFTTIIYPLVYTTVLWAIFMLITGGFSGADPWFFYAILHIPLAPIFFIASFMGDGRLFFWAPIVYEVSFILAFVLVALKRKERFVPSVKKLSIIFSLFILAMGTGQAVQWHRSKTVLPSYGFEYGGGYSSTDLTPYEITNRNNILPKLKEPSTFTIKDTNLMPVLDGAEAAFPVYSAFANATYDNIANMDYKSWEYVTFTNTIYAYERLLMREVDIYFGAEPSKEQRKMAEEQGKELVMTPIGKEAFVFFVNPKNKIDSLDVSEIQAIYSGEIKNWSELGGKNERIVAFQRPKNSGSQTLLEKIMGDIPIIKPLKEEVPRGMGGIIEEVASYRNYDNAIGFSFRFFATGMTGSPDIKLLGVNGIEPSPENISTGTYPFSANLYAITLKDNKKSTVQPFLDWMQGPQGQQIVEEVGYIREVEE